MPRNVLSLIAHGVRCTVWLFTTITETRTRGFHWRARAPPNNTSTSQRVPATTHPLHFQHVHSGAKRFMNTLLQGQSTSSPSGLSLVWTYDAFLLQFRDSTIGTDRFKTEVLDNVERSELLSILIQPRSPRTMTTTAAAATTPINTNLECLRPLLLSHLLRPPGPSPRG